MLEVYDTDLGAGNNVTSQQLLGTVVFESISYTGQSEIDDVVGAGGILIV